MNTRVWYVGQRVEARGHWSPAWEPGVITEVEEHSIVVDRCGATYRYGLQVSPDQSWSISWVRPDVLMKSLVTKETRE